MKIGEVSRRTGLPASTIRYYEKVELIKRQPRVSGCREFDERAIFVLKFVRLAQTAGFSIEETKNLIAAYEHDPGSAGVWSDMARRKRLEIRSMIAELSQMENVLTELLSCNCLSLDECIEAGFKRAKTNSNASR